VQRHPIPHEAIEIFIERDAGGVDRAAVLGLGDQLRLLDLRLALAAFEAYPAALAPAAGILGVDDDGPPPR